MKDFGVGAITAGSNFAANKGKMSFPVPSGQVTERFGRQPHPVFKGITIENNGIKVVVPNGTRARCVFPGVVSNILVSGGAKTVLVKRGDYFSIYGNLDNVNITKNQQVSHQPPLEASELILMGILPSIFKFGMEPIQLIH